MHHWIMKMTWLSCQSSPQIPNAGGNIALFYLSSAQVTQWDASKSRSSSALDGFTRLHRSPRTPSDWRRVRWTTDGTRPTAERSTWWLWLDSSHDSNYTSSTLSKQSWKGLGAIEASNHPKSSYGTALTLNADSRACFLTTSSIFTVPFLSLLQEQRI